jgi:hypothetical protein
MVWEELIEGWLVTQMNFLRRFSGGKWIGISSLEVVLLLNDIGVEVGVVFPVSLGVLCRFSVSLGRSACVGEKWE